MTFTKRRSSLSASRVGTLSRAALIFWWASSRAASDSSAESFGSKMAWKRLTIPWVTSALETRVLAMKSVEFGTPSCSR